nr:UvrD-like helicase, ATP-binding domain, P-loop containing nucleoside triphosphate hydrolase [Tanacetum cinerariifolium]
MLEIKSFIKFVQERFNSFAPPLRRYLSGPMFGSYSFINVVGGREERDDDGKSQRNMVELAIVINIMKKLYRAWQNLKKKLSIGVISPYAAQVILDSRQTCSQMITIAAVEELDHQDDLVNENSVLFRHAKWKVLFSDNFRRSFRKLIGSRLKKQVLNLLLKLSGGWRPKNRSIDLSCENSSHILKQFKLEGFYVICTINIIKEVSYTQLLKELRSSCELARVPRYYQTASFKCKKFRTASDGIYEEESSQFRVAEVVDDNQVAKNVSSNGNSSAKINLDDTNVITSKFNDILDSFNNIPMKNYPLVITFQNFLMMLDGTLGNSYFERFLEVREGSLDNNTSSRSVVLQTFIRLREVTFDSRKSFFHFNQTAKRDIYILLEAYEKTKRKRGEFDLGDLVNDIHHWLKNRNYEDEGFVFVGDTAQTITRGVDFRFQDIRALFYKEFLSSRTTDKQDKGLDFEIKQLKQNFKTHVAVLNLAQSVIDIIYHYFIHSIDKLETEVSLISGEVLLLLESRHDENAIMTIFGGSGEDNVGFGAEQVILVRDDYAKSQVCKFVGKNALVLTILECKGLEFQVRP